MQLSIVKQLASDFELTELVAAEMALLEEKKPEITVGGIDEGEQLTHLLAAIWVKNEMAKENLPLPKALRNYTLKVRTSIS